MFKIIALSGTTDVTENLYIYETARDILVVDCGVGFPDAEMYGVDLIIPDFSYLIKNKNKVRGVLITHGHEDHLGAIPFLLKEMNVDVYATKLSAGFIKDKLKEHRLKSRNLKVFDPERSKIKLGDFSIMPFRVSHSVPDAVGFAIDTPEGRVFHVPDYKFDWTPVDEKPFDIRKAAVLASEKKPLALLSDCLGSTTPGYTESEIEIEGRIEAIARKASGRIFFTTISSNISRIQQAINVAIKLNRSVCFIGRSIHTKSEIAKELGLLNYPKHTVVDPRRAGRLPVDEVMYIISGSYGQPGSSLYRYAMGEHDFIEPEKKDLVIFSGDPAPPGSKSNVDFLVDKLIEMNVEVHYYDMQEDLHVSGHGSIQDILMLFALVSPQNYIPIGGTIRHMRAYKDLALKMGAKEEQVFEPMPGDVIEFRNGNARIASKIPAKNVLVDGLGIGDVGRIVLRDRQKLAQDGIAIVLIQIDQVKKELIDKPEIISRGFVFEGQKRDFLNKTASKLASKIKRLKTIDKRSVRNTTIDYLENYFYKETGRRPMVLPVIVEI